MVLRSGLAALFLLAVIAVPEGAASQSSQEEFRIYSDQPRLLLRARRLRLLRRESERESIRWQQIELLIAGKARMPEAAFALALYSRAGGDPSYCSAAVQQALEPSTDLRQQALVYDWCLASAPAAQSRKLEAVLRRAVEIPKTSPSIPRMRDFVFASIALADRLPDRVAAQMRFAVEKWWRGEISPALNSGRLVIERGEYYALFELLHAVRDNLNIDLRQSSPAYFKELPNALVLSYYPAPYPAAENLYRIPAAATIGEPDLERAALARAAELALVAYDPNAQASQFLQGWLIHDQFLLRGAFGIVYEFLWANPYLPGLSYYHLPLAFHDPAFGRLYLRSSWEDDATWLGWIGGELQVFENGSPRIVTNPTSSEAIRIGDAVVVLARSPARFEVSQPEAKVLFVLGLKPDCSYEIEIDDEEMDERTSDRGGILTLTISPRPGLGVRIREAPHSLRSVSQNR